MSRLLGIVLLIVLFVVPWTISASRAQIGLALTTTPSPRAAYLPIVVQPGATYTTGPATAVAATTTVSSVPTTATQTRVPSTSPVPATTTATPSSTSPHASASPTATNTPTLTPTLQPPTFNNCQADPNPSAAPNYPVKIVAIDKVAETVTLRNVGVSTVDFTGWHMCSILGNQEHPISGTLAPGAEQTFPGPSGNIWNNSQRDDGALYNPDGQLVSYFVDNTN